MDDDDDNDDDDDDDDDENGIIHIYIKADIIMISMIKN